MADITHDQARAGSDRILQASDLERELRRMRRDSAPDRTRSGAGFEVLLAIVIVALIAFIVTAGDGEGGLAMLKIFTTLFG